MNYQDTITIRAADLDPDLPEWLAPAARNIARASRNHVRSIMRASGVAEMRSTIYVGAGSPAGVAGPMAAIVEHLRADDPDEGMEPLTYPDGEPLTDENHPITQLVSSQSAARARAADRG